MDYRKIISTLRREEIGAKGAKSGKSELPLMKELPSPPTFGRFLQRDVLFHIIAGGVFAVGHYVGIRLAEAVVKLIERSGDRAVEKLGDEIEAVL